MKIENNVFDTALVFEGGGMRASYSSGVANALLENEIYFNYVAGISAGASCTVNYLSRDMQRTKESFVDFVKDPNFGGWRTFLRGKGFFNAEYIYQESCLPGSDLPYNYEVFLKNPADISIGAYNMTKSELVYWSKADIKGMEDLMLMVRASSTLPIYMPTVEIDGDEYIDGGIAGGIAIDAAEASGFDKFVFVLTRERGYRKMPPTRTRVLKRTFKDYPKTIETILNRYKVYNETLDRIEQLEREGRAFIIAPYNMPIDNREKNIRKLEKMYQMGLSQGRKLIPKLNEFLKK